MVCPKCKSEDAVFDNLTGMWFCSQCNYMWESEEEDTPQDEEEGQGNSYQEESLNGFSLFVLQLLMAIPVLDLFITGTITNSRIEEQYKKTFMYRFIVNMFVYLSIIVVTVMFLKDIEIKVERNIAKVVGNNVNLMLTDADDPVFPQLVTKSYWELVNQRLPENEVIIETELPQEYWRYLDDTTMSGKSAISLIEDVYQYDSIILIQTVDIAKRYNDSTYRCLGIIPVTADINDSSNNWFYGGKVTADFEFRISDYGDYVTDKIDDIYSSKYIYYVNPKSSFVVNVLHAEDGTVVGIALKEETK